MMWAHESGSGTWVQGRRSVREARDLGSWNVGPERGGVGSTIGRRSPHAPGTAEEIVAEVGGGASFGTLSGDNPRIRGYRADLVAILAGASALNSVESPGSRCSTRVVGADARVCDGPRT